MHRSTRLAAASAFSALLAIPAMHAQSGPTVLDTTRSAEIQAMVARLDLEKYKATIKGLTQFGDRRQGTARNRAAVDWIEAQLKSYGCTNTERVTYTYTSPPPRGGGAGRAGAGGDTMGRSGRAGGGGRGDWGSGGSRPARRPHADRREHRLAQADGSQAARTGLGTRERWRASGGVLHEGRDHAPRGDVHRRRPHGRPRMGRGGERRRLGHRARHGARAHLQQSRRADGPFDPIRPVEQRGNRTQRCAGVRRAASGAAGKGKSAGIRQVSGAEVARHDPARHDAVRSRHAAPGRHHEPRAAAGSRREHRIRDDLEDVRGRAEARMDLRDGQRQVRHGLSGRRSDST